VLLTPMCAAAHVYAIYLLHLLRSDRRRAYSCTQTVRIPSYTISISSCGREPTGATMVLRRAVTGRRQSSTHACSGVGGREESGERCKAHQIIGDDRVGRHEAREPSRPVRKLWRDGYARTRASAQLRHALVEPWDDLTDAESEPQLPVALAGRVPHFPVG